MQLGNVKVKSYKARVVARNRDTERVRRLLAKRFGLSDLEREQIESCEDRDALDAALDEIVVAESKEAVLAKLSSGSDRGVG